MSPSKLSPRRLCRPGLRFLRRAVLSSRTLRPGCFPAVGGLSPAREFRGGFQGSHHAPRDGMSSRRQGQVYYLADSVQGGSRAAGWDADRVRFPATRLARRGESRYSDRLTQRPPVSRTNPAALNLLTVPACRLGHAAKGGGPKIRSPRGLVAGRLTADGAAVLLLTGAIVAYTQGHGTCHTHSEL